MAEKSQGSTAWMVLLIAAVSGGVVSTAMAPHRADGKGGSAEASKDCDSYTLKARLGRDSLDLSVAQPCKAANWKDGRTLLAEFFGDTGKALAAGYGSRARIQGLVVTVPDPLDSRRDQSFDANVDAVVRAMGTAGYVLDRYWLPWVADREPAKDGSRTSLRTTRPGVILFRRDDPDSLRTPRLQLVYLVGEIATAGIQKTAFRNAVADLDSLVDEDTLRVIGPSFSGSATSLRLALDNLPSRVRPRVIDLITGSATSPGIAGILSDPPRISFRSTIRSVAALQLAETDLLKYLHVPCNQRASIHEVGTAYGLALGNSAGSNHCGAMLDIQFPVNVSGLRSAYEQLPSVSGAGSQPLTLRPDLPLDSGGSRRNREGLPSLSGLTPATLDLLLDQIAHTMQARRIHLAVVGATDVRDKIFLIRELSRRVPGLRFVILESDVLLLRAESRGDLVGTFVISTYPLVPNFAWSGLRDSSDASIYPFATDGTEGTYNAALTLLKLPGLMVDYGIPCTLRLATTEDPRDCQPGDTTAWLSTPPVWVSAIGKGAMVPVFLWTGQGPDRHYLVHKVMKRARQSGPWRDSTAITMIALVGICLLVVANKRVALVNQVDLEAGTEDDSLTRGFEAAIGTQAVPSRRSRLLNPLRDMVAPIVQGSREGGPGRGRMLYRNAALLTGSLGLLPLVLSAVMATVGRIWEAVVVVLLLTLAGPVYVGARGTLLGLFPQLWRNAVALSGENWWRRHFSRDNLMIFGIIALAVAIPFLLALGSNSVADFTFTGFNQLTARVREFSPAIPSVVIIVIGVLLAWWVRDDVGRAGLALRVLILFLFGCILLFTVAYASALGSIGKVGALRDLYLYRAFHLETGLSPLLPFLVLGAIGVVWARFHYYRFKTRKQSSLFTVALHGTPLPGLASLDHPHSAWHPFVKRAGEVRRCLTQLIPTTHAGYVMAFTIIVLFVTLAMPMQPTPEHVALEAGRPGAGPAIGWWAFDCLLSTAAIAAFAAVIWALYRVVGLWLRFSQVLVAIARIPVVTALERLPRRIARITQFSLVGGDYRDALRDWQLVRRSHLERWRARIGAWQEENAYFVSLPALPEVGEKLQLVEELLELCMALELWWAAEPGSEEVKDVCERVKKGDASPSKPISSLSGEIRRSFSSDHRVWLRGAEEYVATELVNYIQETMIGLRRFSQYLITMLLLAVMLGSTYADQPGHTYALGLLALVIASVGVLVAIVIKLNQDEVLSRITKTAPGEVSWDSGLLLNLMLVAGIPILGYISSTVPNVRDFLFGWVSPVIKALVHS